MSHHEQLIQALPYPLLVLDDKQRIQEANAAFLDWVGKKHDSVIGKPAAKLLPTLKKPLAQLMNGGMLSEEQELYGRVVVVRSSALDADHSTNLLTFQDATTHNRGTAHSKREQQYRALLQHTSDAVLVLDPNLSIVEANPRAAALLGEDAAALQQKSAPEYFAPEWKNRMRGIVEALAIGEEVPVFEATLAQGAETLIPVEVTLTLIRDAENKPLEIQMILQDIRNRQLTRSTLETRLERVSLLHAIDTEVNHTLEIDSVMLISLRAAVDLSGADAGCIALAEEAGLVVRQVMGTYPEGLLGTFITEDYTLVREAIEKGEPLYMPEGVQQPQLPGIQTVMVFPLIVQDRFIGVLLLGAEDPAHFTDDDFEFIQLIASRLGVALENARLHEYVRNQVTELERLNQELRDTERLKTDMLRIANHDLKNPLGIVRGYVSIFEVDQHLLPPEYADFIESMRNSLDRMETIMDDFLTVEAFKVRAAQAEMATVDLRPLVQKALKEYSEQAADQQKNLTATLPEDEALFVIGDDPQLYEAITNLISNALKYTPTGGTVHVSLQADDAGDVVFKVEDNGYGIPGERQANLFNPFFRSRTQETVTIEGTGLGLHLVKNIIERHKGEIIFHSVYREGSTFGFRLKRVTPAEDEA
jgi:PAS domain S-box-containing protein